jgi:glycine cleavage system H protein
VDLRLLRYTPDHLWVKIDDDNNASIGLTEEGVEDYAELFSVRLPSEGDEFQKDQQFGRVTVDKGLGFKLLAPFAGEVIAVNEDILEAPDTILEDPYEEGWLVRMSVNSMSEYDDLMSRDEYDQYLADTEIDGISDDDEDDADAEGLFYDSTDGDDEEDDDEDFDEDYYDDDDDDEEY